MIPVKKRRNQPTGEDGDHQDGSIDCSSSSTPSIRKSPLVVGSTTSLILAMALTAMALLCILVGKKYGLVVQPGGSVFSVFSSTLFPKKTKETPPLPPPPPSPKYGGKMNHGVYRFKAEQLGVHFERALEFFETWIGDTYDGPGAAFAQQRTALPHVLEYNQDCYQLPQVDRMIELERQKKTHPWPRIKHNDDKNKKRSKKHERLQYLVEEQAMFFNDTAQTPLPQLTHITHDSLWAWRAAASFSAQHSGRQSEFRRHINARLRNDPFLAGRVSGTFWYPPNAVREWHTNYLDVKVNATTGELVKPWRMYYARQKPAKAGSSLHDASAFHLVDGNGITPERLRELGARQLTFHDNKNVDDKKKNDHANQQQQQPTTQPTNVWRIPDQEGYINLFRLEVQPPFRWHCIVSNDRVHRYSLGMSMTDNDVAALLEHIGVEL